MLCVRRWSDAGPWQSGSGVGKYSAEIPKQGSQRFNSVTKPIHFAHLDILFVYGKQNIRKTYICFNEIGSMWYKVVEAGHILPFLYPAKREKRKLNNCTVLYIYMFIASI